MTQKLGVGESDLMQAIERHAHREPATCAGCQHQIAAGVATCIYCGRKRWRDSLPDPHARIVQRLQCLVRCKGLLIVGCRFVGIVRCCLGSVALRALARVLLFLLLLLGDLALSLFERIIGLGQGRVSVRAGHCSAPVDQPSELRDQGVPGDTSMCPARHRLKPRHLTKYQRERADNDGLHLGGQRRGSRAAAHVQQGCPGAWIF
jgi:hypothetical protein